MKVKIKKLVPEAIIPQYSKKGDAGLDLTAITVSKDTKDNLVYGTGLAIMIPEGYVGLVFPRSSISNYEMHLRNGVGVIDSGYRGEIMLKFGHAEGDVYKPGDRVGQLVILPYPEVVWQEVDAVEQTERGAGGFGSTNK